jgi:lipopolysaccharide export system permease protein
MPRASPVALLDRYLAREILLPFAGVLLFLTQVLLAVQLLVQANLLLGSGVVSLGDFLGLSLALTPHYLGNVLPAAFLLGVVLGVGRLSADQEIVAMCGAGISPWRLARTPLALGVALAVAGLWLAFRAEPAGLRHAQAKFDGLIKKSLVAGVSPGVFYDRLPDLTLYVEKVDRRGWRHVLISDLSHPETPLLMLARQGELRADRAGERLELVLSTGEVHREELSRDDYATAAFRRATAAVSVGSALSRQNRLVGSPWKLGFREMRERATHGPGRDPRDVRRWQGLLHRRIATALAVIPFAMIAAGIGVWRGAGRGAAIPVTIGAAVVHYVLLRAGETMARAGTLPAVLSLQLPNLVLVALGGLLLYRLERRGAHR